MSLHNGMSAPSMSFTPSLAIDEAASYLSSASALSKVSNTIKLEVYITFCAETFSDLFAALWPIQIPNGVSKTDWLEAIDL